MHDRASKLQPEGLFSSEVSLRTLLKTGMSVGLDG